MSYRILPLFLVAVAVAFFVAGPVLADDETKANTHTGLVVSISGQKLVMKGTGEDATEHTHTIADNAIVTCDGRKCEVSDLKVGQKIRVTTKRGDQTVAIKVEALDKNLDFPKGTAQDQ